MFTVHRLCLFLMYSFWHPAPQTLLDYFALIRLHWQQGPNCWVIPAWWNISSIYRYLLRHPTVFHCYSSIWESFLQRVRRPDEPRHISTFYSQHSALSAVTFLESGYCIRLFAYHSVRPLNRFYLRGPLGPLKGLSWAWASSHGSEEKYSGCLPPKCNLTRSLKSALFFRVTFDFNISPNLFPNIALTFFTRLVFAVHVALFHFAGVCLSVCSQACRSHSVGATLS